MAGNQIDPSWEHILQEIQREMHSNIDTESVLEMLYESFSEQKNLETLQIKADFNALYEAMNDMALQECDRVIYPVCALCRDHEKNGFINGIKVGFTLYQELCRANKI